MDGTTFPAATTSRLIEYEGEPAFVTSVVDLTDQRAAEAEIQRQRETLHQSEKLAALGALLAGVAHELNNPLSVVVGYSSMLQELAQDDASRQRAAQGARRRRTLCPDRQDIPGHGPFPAATVWAGPAERGRSRMRSSSPATACAPPTSRSSASTRPICRRSGATATSSTRS